MFNVLVGLQIFAIVLILFSLVYIFRRGSTYAQRLMLSFMIAELIHNAGYLLELFARSEREAIDCQHVMCHKKISTLNSARGLCWWRVR
jgi:hypothetical protein